MKKQPMDRAGEVKGAGGGGGKAQTARTPVEAPNTLQAFIRGRILDLIAYGPIKGLVNGLKSVYLENTPVQNADDTFNFEGVELEFRNGTPDQDVIPGFRSVENTTEVNTEILFDNPPVRTVTNNDADAIAVTVQLAGLAQQQDNGDVVGTSVTVLVDISDNGGAWVNLFATEIKGKTTSAYPQTYRINLPDTDGPFSVRVRRANKESDSDKLRDALTWTLLTEIIDQPFSYPNMALAGITVNSKLFGSSMPSRTYDVYLSVVKVPSNYNPDTREYTGLWDGTFKEAWTDNPAWAYYDLATHPIIGAGLQNVDKWELYRIAQYCDALVPDGFGGMEPRFTINTVFSDQEDAYVALSTLAGIFRGMTYWGTNTVVPVADMPTTPSRIVGPANVIGGDFNYVGTADRERHSVCVVMWNDPNDMGKPVPEVYEDADAIAEYGWRETRVTAVGCNSRGQAHRLAKWILYSERMETQTLTYKAKLDHATVRPGDIIEVADPDYQGVRMAGRVKEPAQSYLILDAIDHEALATVGGTWFVSVVMPDQRIEKRQVSSFAGNTAYLVGSLPEVPIPGAIWALSSAGLLLPQYRVVSVKEEENSTYVISATEYDPNKYDFVEYDLKLPERPTSLIPTGPITPPTDMTFEVYKYQAGGGEHQGVLVSWKPSMDVRVESYVLDVQGPADASYRTVYNGAGVSFDLKDATGGQWLFRVRAMAKGIPSQWLMRTVQVQMLLLPTPPDSVDVKVGTFDVTLTPRSAYPDALWEFWRSLVPLEAAQIEGSASYIATGTYLADTGLKPDTQYYYFIRGVNQYGKSTWYAAQAKTANDFDDILEAVTKDIEEGALYEIINEQIDTKATQVAIDKATEVVNDAMVGVNQQLTDIDAELGTIGTTLTDLNAEVDTLRTNTNAAIGQLTSDLASNVSSINSQITAINTTTSGLRTDLTSLQGTVSTEVGRINNTLTDLQSQITNAVDAQIYDKSKAYTAGQFTYIGNSLYQAKINVPAKADGTNAPPNATYWRDAGTVIASADGLAARVTANETSIGTINGTLTSQASTISGIQTTLNGKADASALTALTNRVTAAEGTITSQGTAITNLTNTVNGKADASALTALTTRVTTAEGTISSQGTAITNLTNTVAGKADASALTALTTRVTANETAITSQANSLTSIQSILGQQPDNLILKGTFEDGTVGPWTNTPVITNVSAHASYSKALAFYTNSFCGTTNNVVTVGGEQFDLSADVWNNYMTAGQTARLQMQFFDKAAASLGYFTAFTVNSGTNGFQPFSGRITAPAGAVVARFVIRHETSDGTGRSLWVNMVARRVTAADSANAAATSALTTRVTAAEGTITSQGTAITNLTNTVNGKADASALTALTTRVTTAEGTIASQGTAITNLTNTVNGKADASALTALTTRVTTAEGTISSQGSAITSLTNTVAGKADSSTVTGLSNTVTQQGNTLAAQGTAVTNIQATLGNIAGSGVNLLQSEYSWLPSTTLPNVNSALLNRSGVAVTDAPSGFGYYLQPTSNSLFSYLVLAPFNSPAYYNLPLEAGTYLVSFYAKGDTAGQVMANLYDGTTSRSATQNYTTDRQRLTFAITLPAAAKSVLLIYPNRQGATPPVGLTIDSIMVEKRVGETNVPSPFVAGAAGNQMAGMASATTALEARVTAAEGVNTSQSTSITNLTNSLAGKADASALTALTTRVTTAEGTISSQGTAITNLTNSLAGKADASALTALTTRVTTAEGLLTSQGSSITTLNNQIGGIGGDNMLTNSSFETLSSPTMASWWVAASPTAGIVTSIVDSTLPQSVKALRLDHSAIPVNGYLEVRANDSTAATRIKVRGGASYVLSAWARGTAGMIFRSYIRWHDAAGAVLTTPTVAGTLSTTYARFTQVEVAPANAASAYIYVARIINSGTATAALWIEVDNVQFQEGTVATNYTPSVEQTAAAQAAATTALTTRVDQAESTLTSQGTAITNLTNSLAGKADASALTALTTRVTTAENTISSQGTAITNLTNSVAGKADASALNALTTRVTTAEGLISSQGSSLLTLTSIIGQQPDNLVLKGTFEDGTIGPWTADPTIANVSAHPSYSKAIQFMANSFCGTTRNIITRGGEEFDCSADIWNNYMTAGQTARLQIQFYDKNVVNLGYFTAFTCYAGATGFQTYSGRITAPVGAVTCRFVIRHETADGTGRSLWCNIVARRVSEAESANAAATTALTTRVTATETSLTSQASSITNLQANLNSIGGDNLLPNSSFETLAAGSSVLADWWATAATVAGIVNSIVDSDLPQSTKAQRVDHPALPVNGYAEIRGVNSAALRLKAKPGPYVLTSWARTTAGAGFRQFISYYNSAGTLITTHSSTFIGTETFTRYTLPVTAPAGTVSILVYGGRVTNLGTATGAFWMELDNVQFQEGTVATAYSPGVGLGLSSAAAATSALDTRLTSAEGTITSQGSAITNLTNSVATKADASAVTALTTRVTTAEGLITSQGNSITSLNNSLAGKADVTALNSLTTRVTNAETAITSQATATTALQTTLANQGGNGTNLVPDSYSWLTSTTLPTTTMSAGSTLVGVAVSGAASGFGYKYTSPSTNTGVYFMMSPTNNAAGYNVPLEAGTYLVSFYASAPAAATVRMSLFDGTGRVTPNFALTTTRTRYAGIVTVAAATKVALTCYPNLAAVAGTEVTIDSVMIEKMNNGATVATPSPFVAGPSAATAAAQASAINALDVRVTSAEGVNTSQASSITSLTSRMGTAETNITTTASSLASTNGALTSLWAAKIQTTAGGKQYFAGMGVSMITSGGITQSEILFQADRLALVNASTGGISVPFFIENGVTYIQTAMIKAAAITNAHIADGNITYAKIGGAEVGTAHIRDGNITTAKIQDLSVNTLKIAGRAVTIPSAAYTEGTITCPGAINAQNWTAVSGLGVNGTGFEAMMTFTAMVSQNTAAGYWRVRRSDGAILASGQIGYAQYVFNTPCVSLCVSIMVAAAGYWAYYLDISPWSNTVTYQTLYVANRGITYLEVMR